MAGGYSVGAPELITLAKDITDTDSQAQALLRQLRSTCDGLQAAWSGSAAAAFQKLMVRLDEDANKLQQALRDIAEQISGSAQIYQEQEAEQDGAMSAISNRLGG